MKFLRLAFILVFLVSPRPALAVTWIPNFSDNFTRPNAAFAGNNWADWSASPACVVGAGSGCLAPGFSISSNTLQSNYSGQGGGVNPYNLYYLTRPAQESPTINQRIVFTTPAINTGANTGYVAGLKIQANGDYYLARLETQGGGAIAIYKIIGSVATNIAISSPTVTNGHVYSVDFSVTGSSPTTLSETVIDITASTTLGTISGTDSTAELQTVPGLIGLSQIQSGNTVFSSFTDYSDQAAAASPPYYVIGGVGDSITVGSLTTIVSSFQAACDIIAGAIAPINVYCVDEGVSGATTANWQPGQSFYNTALAAFQAAGVNTIFEMLGTNDSKTAIATTPSTWQANMIAMNLGFLGSLPGVSIMADCSPYLSYSIISGGSLFNTGSNPLIQQYCALMPNVAAAAPQQIFVGDTKAFNAFSGATTWMFMHNTSGSGLHPNDVGAAVLGYLWAEAFLRHIGAVGGYYFLY